MLTRLSVLVRKWVAPIHALSVPNGCSTIWRRSAIACGTRSSRLCMASSMSGRWIAAPSHAPMRQLIVVSDGTSQSEERRLGSPIREVSG